MNGPHTVRNYLTEDERARIVEEEHLRFQVRWREFCRLLVRLFLKFIAACTIAIIGFATLWYLRIIHL